MLFRSANCIYLEHLYIYKNNEFNHGGSQHIDEAPHNFILNSLKDLAWFQNRILIEPILDSQIHFLFGNI